MGACPDTSERQISSTSNKRKRSSTTNQTSSSPRLGEGCRQNNVAAMPMLTSMLGLTSKDDAAALDAMATSCQIQIHSVLSSSKIQKKVVSILHHISTSSDNGSQTNPRGRVSILHARASDSAKLIAIAEIVKRELAQPCYQYTALGEDIREQPRSGKDGPSLVEDTMLRQRSTGDGPDNQSGNGSITVNDEDGDFEIMKTRLERAVEGRPLVRGVPVIAIFLSLAPIEALRKKFGEQYYEGRPC